MLIRVLDYKTLSETGGLTAWRRDVDMVRMIVTDARAADRAGTLYFNCELCNCPLWVTTAVIVVTLMTPPWLRDVEFDEAE